MSARAQTFLNPEPINIYSDMPGMFPGLAGFVYVVAAGGQPYVKIGIAGHLPSRLSSLQTGNFADLSIAAAVAVYEVNPEAVEMLAHAYAGETHRRARGEWFEMEPAQAVECILRAVDFLGVTHRTMRGCWDHGVATAAGMTPSTEDLEAERRRTLRVKLGIE